jgi:hypothetical protein
VIDTPEVCLKLNGTTNVLVQACPTGKKCGVTITASTQPTEILAELQKGDIKCVDNSAPVAKTAQVPGDYCMTNDNCASKVCKENSCQPKAALGGDCADTSDCGVGQYCAELKCATVKATGSECTTFMECGFLSLCFEDPKT